MITFKKFGSHGRLGNQLFQYATMMGFCQKYGCDMVLPEWKYAQYFEHPPQQSQVIVSSLTAKEPYFHYTPAFWDKYAESFRNQTVDVLGWLQTEKYWEHCADEVKQRLQFKTELKNQLQEKYKLAFGKEVIAISIRRGDYVGNPNYELLPINYYALALYEHFPNLDDYNIIIFSDDFKYAKHHFECLSNVYFAEGEDGISQLCLMSLCDHFIIANSTFSWWGAYLGEKQHSKVIRPNYVFAGPLLKQSTWKDHYPERWTVFDHKEGGEYKKFDLSDVTFTIPVAYDHEDRVENLLLNLKMLTGEYNTNIIIGEQRGTYFEQKVSNCRYINFSDMRVFHRTRMLNVMCEMAETPIIANWDADVFIPFIQLIETVRTIRNGKVDMMYPYDGRFARVPRGHKTYLEANMDLGIFAPYDFKGTRPEDQLSVGGAVLWSREKFIESGMENEHMVSYAPEDVERYERAHRLGYVVARTKGILYHLDHWTGPDSSHKHTYFGMNWEELRKIRKMTDQELREYVNSWGWTKGEHYEVVKPVVIAPPSPPKVFVAPNKGKGISKKYRHY